MKTGDQNRSEARIYRAPELTTFGDMTTFTAAGIASMDEGPGAGNEARTPKP